ncbi:SRPBCC domain-containing protein [Plantactinospora solaniradicis]|uniref:SRPBCC domain-containing protein n=1 Tax=Plantactinospora solaniradicis TaxID=1723736 RepID=A0ABW1KHN1_9ACTN
MTEIRTTVDLRHPPERVWRALTDRELLPKWFGSVEPRPSSISRFELRPADLPELDELITVELVELDPPHRIVVRWLEDGQPTQVVCELTPTAEGCRLTVTHGDAEDPFRDTGIEDPFLDSGIDDPWRPTDLDRREQAYQQLLDTRLPAVLDWLAFREVDLPEATAVIGAVPAGAAPDRRSRRKLGIGLAVLALAVGAVVVVAGLARGRTESGSAGPVATVGSPAPTTGPGTAGPAAGSPTTGPATAPPSRSTRPTPRRTPTTPPARPANPGQPDLAARYTTLRTGLLGYRGEVVVTNGGNAAARSWTVVITLPAGAEVSTASGASFVQEDERVTFTGAALPADRSATIQFEVVRDATLTQKQPTSCVVQDRPCEGL